MNSTMILSAMTATCNACGGSGIRMDQTFPMDCEARDGRCAVSGERIRKNGTCAHHACYRCDGDGTLSKRASFMQALSERIDVLCERDGASDADWRELAQAVAVEGRSVSSAKMWQSAVSWFGAELRDERNAQSARWIVTQGSVWLGHGSV